MTEPRQRKEKKSETLEVRLPYGDKQAFLNACREDGTTASEIVRESIQDYLAARERPATQSGQPDAARTLIAMIPQPIRKKRWLAAGAGAAGLAMLTGLPSAAAPDFKGQFDRLDKNKDGVLSSEEFLSHAPPAGAGGDQMRIEMRTVHRTTSGDPAAAPTPDGEKAQAFVFQLPEGAAGAKPGEQNVERRVEVRRVDKDGKELSSDHSSTVIAGTVDGLDEDTKAMLASLKEGEFKRYDANGDGKVSLTEYSERQLAMLTNGFNMLDADKDGGLSTEEYAKLGRPVQVTMRLSGDGGGPTVEIPKTAVVNEQALKDNFTKLDADKNGKLSLQEYLPKA